MYFKQKNSPALWFDSRAEEAIAFYMSVFKNSRMSKVLRYGEAGPGPEGTVMTISFELDGHELTAINGGPHFMFSPAISFAVVAKLVMKWIIIGKSFLRARIRISADGLQTNSECRGK